MAISEDAAFDNQVLQDMNSWTEDVYHEIQASGAPNYEPTCVEPLDREYRKEMGDYLTETFGFDYASTVDILEGTKALYHKGNDSIVVSYDLLGSPLDTYKKGFLAHEQGHRLGNKIVEDKLRPFDKGSPTERLANYLGSENFAERAKVAIGNSVGENFSYDTCTEGTPAVIYAMKDRIGPEEFIDSERNETLPEMMDNIEDHITEISQKESL